MSEMTDVEALLRSALVPVEPSEALSRPARAQACRRSPTWRPTSWPTGSCRRCATRATGAAPWPRWSWASAAAGALVLVRARQQQKKRQVGSLRALERSLRDVAEDLGRRLER